MFVSVSVTNKDYFNKGNGKPMHSQSSKTPLFYAFTICSHPLELLKQISNTTTIEISQIISFHLFQKQHWCATATSTKRQKPNKIKKRERERIINRNSRNHTDTCRHYHWRPVSSCIRSKPQETLRSFRQFPPPSCDQAMPVPRCCWELLGPVRGRRERTWRRRLKSGGLWPPAATVWGCRGRRWERAGDRRR